MLTPGVTQQVDDPVGEVAALALVHAVIVDGVFVVRRSQQLAVAAIDAATIANNDVVDVLAVEKNARVVVAGHRNLVAQLRWIVAEPHTRLVILSGDRQQAGV